MQTIRRNGSFVALTWAGQIPHPDHDHEFQTRLAANRFRTIENAASEEESVGWISPSDPSGDTHAPDDMMIGSGQFWLRARSDRKRLPAQWVAKHMAAAQRAKGRALSAKERREVRDSLAESLLPRVLPTTQDLDALVFDQLGLVLLFSTGKAARESFAKLWFATFAFPLDLLGPRQLAERLEFDAGLMDGLQPTRWPVGARSHA